MNHARHQLVATITRETHRLGRRYELLLDSWPDDQIAALARRLAEIESAGRMVANRLRREPWRRASLNIGRGPQIGWPEMSDQTRRELTRLLADAEANAKARIRHVPRWQC